ncbi:sugar porter family MFS transporter [Segetibacter aerophilus]|uniref:MFS transporter n=1 Tax=Segetibacter aerophilus TaxID=670293 RepID=A0A512BIP3_9BACT|nr:sugar porter family MFS transporter [Segetibacter aerophilus]GEO11834.1 MFS transporter [Segetibacter aerophilus]
MKENRRVIGYSVIVALGGLLFGLDTAVISGAEQPIQALYKLSNFKHGFTVAIAIIGAVVGAFSAGFPAEVFGRKKVIIAIAFIFTISSVLCAVAPNWAVLVIFRFVGGLAIGASSVVGPMYIAEIAPAKLRGRLVAFFQLNVTVGLFVAYSSNYLFSGTGDNAWRWMLGIVAVPSIIFFLLSLIIPESPRWLIKHNRVKEAREVLTHCGRLEIEKEIDDILESLKVMSSASAEKLFTKKYFRPILYAVLMGAFNQLAGTNAINYYATRIFEMTGMNTNISYLLPILIGLTKVIVLIIAMNFIDRFGRRSLMILGSVGLIIFMSLIAWTFYGKHFDGPGIVYFLLGYMFFFGLSDGIVIWVFISEIFPNSIRSKGQSLGSFTHWFFAVIISWTFPVAINSPAIGPGNVFMFFAVMMCLQLLFSWKLMPETKGKSLEQIQKDLKIQY